MKIGMIHLNLSYEGGDSRMFFSIAKHFKNLGNDVLIYTSAHNKNAFPEIQDGLAVEEINPDVPLDSFFGEGKIFEKIINRFKRARLYGNTVAKIQEHLRSDFEILICQNDYSYSLGAWYKKINPAVKTVWLMNNVPYYRSPKSSKISNILSWGASLFEWHRAKKYAGGMDLIIVHDEERKKLAEKLKRPVAILRIPVDYESFYQPIRRLEPEQKSVHLLSVGSLSPARKYEDIIKAVAILSERNYDATATFVCKDFWKNSGYKSKLLDLVKKLNLSDKITFLFDGVSERELRTIQKGAHFFIFPTHINIWNMSSLEAMAAGLPLILSRESSIAEVLKDNKTGVFFEAGNNREMADKISMLLESPRLYAEITENGQKFVKENLNWNLYAQKLLNLIRQK